MPKATTSLFTEPPPPPPPPVVLHLLLMLLILRGRTFKCAPRVRAFHYFQHRHSHLLTSPTTVYQTRIHQVPPNCALLPRFPVTHDRPEPRSRQTSSKASSRGLL